MAGLGALEEAQRRGLRRMTHADEGPDHLSDYERAVCYYTLPRVTSPLTIGLVAAYAICLLEALGALCFGVLTGRNVWIEWGTICLAAIIVFGVVAFLIRAFLNDVRQRKSLAAAHGVPDAMPDEAEGLPDPFANHILLRLPRHRPPGPVSITDNEGTLRYTVETGAHGRSWTIRDEAGNEYAQVLTEAKGGSFLLNQSTPRKLVVRRGEEEIARLERGFSLMDSIVEIVCNGPTPQKFQTRGRNLYKEGKLIGRVYYIRRYIYLDVEEDSFHDGILSFFVAMA